MPEYIFHAVDQDGQSVSGEIVAASVAEGVASLESRGLTIQSISTAAYPNIRIVPAASTAADSVDRTHAPESSLDRLFDSAIEHRDTLVPALRALASELPAGQTRHEIEQLIQNVLSVNSGVELRHSPIAIRWLPLLATGFSDDATSRRVSDLIEYASRDSQIRAEQRRLLAYPIVVMFTLWFVLSLLCLIVVPTYEKMFSDFGMNLPAPTLALVGITRQFQFHPLRTILIVVVAAATVYAIVRLWTHFALTTRLFGSLIAGNSPAVGAMSSLTGQLAALLQIGVPVSDALWIAGQGCEHHYFQRAAEQLARDSYARPASLSQSGVASVFPRNMIHALELGDRPSCVALLRELSSLYAQRVHRRVDWSTGAIAQISIVILGIAIGFIVISLLMPLLNLITALS